MCWWLLIEILFMKEKNKLVEFSTFQRNQDCFYLMPESKDMSTFYLNEKLQRINYKKNSIKH
jgi:hypothetical protein